MVQGPRPAEVPGCASLPLDQGLPGDARGVDSCQDQGGGPQLLLPQGQVQGGEGRDLDHHCYKTRLCGAGQVLLLNGGVYWELPVTT